MVGSWPRTHVSGAQAAKTLLETAPFRKVDPAALRLGCAELCRLGLITRWVVPAETVLLREGDEGESLFVVESGRLEVFVGDIQGTGQHHVANLGPGDLVGEMAVLQQGRRTASGRATTSVTLLELEIGAVRALLQQFPAATVDLLSLMLQRQAGLESISRREYENNAAGLLLLGELRQAIEQRQFLLHYQPQVDFRTRRLVGVESLARWLHPHQGLIRPDLFIPLAEQTNLIHSVTYWVFDAVLDQVARWNGGGFVMRVSINVSARDLRDPQLPDRVAALCEQRGVAAGQLMVEITEGGLMADPEQALEIITRLRGMGIKISIDDFGTGYSSLSYLHRLRPDELKIDKVFVWGMADDPINTAIIRSSIELGHQLGMEVIAEGVRDEPTWDALAAMGCDLAQGYYVSPPLPPTELEHWIRRPDVHPDGFPQHAPEERP